MCIEDEGSSSANVVVQRSLNPFLAGEVLCDLEREFFLNSFLWFKGDGSADETAF